MRRFSRRRRPPAIITSGNNVFALSGDVCAATGRSYNPPPTLSPPLPTPPPTFPVSYTGFAFFAYNGGVITSTGGVTIIANNNPAPTPPALPESSAYGVWSDGGQINLTAGLADVQTSGATAYDLYASNGGAITLGDGKIQSSGAGAFGLYASGAGSTITATGTALTVQTGVGGTAAADGVVADTGGTVNLMTGGVIKTNVGGSIGLVVEGSSSTITGSGLSVQSIGDSISPQDTGAAFNGGAGVSNSPGLNLTGSNLTANGMAAFGVYTTDAGITALNGGSVSTAGQLRAPGLWASGPNSLITDNERDADFHRRVQRLRRPGGLGGKVTFSGGTVMTSGIGARRASTPRGGWGRRHALNDHGDGVAVTTGQSDPGPGRPSAVGVLASAGGQVMLTSGSVTTFGNGAYGVVANSGGFVQINGTSISTNGNGSGGLGINGAGSEIDASNATISTTGGYDSSTGLHSYGVYNGPYGSFTTGGVASSQIRRSRRRARRCTASSLRLAASTTILGGSISTAGTRRRDLYNNGGSRLSPQ